MVNTNSGKNFILKLFRVYNGLVFLRPGYHLKNSAKNLNRAAGNTGYTYGFLSSRFPVTRFTP